MKLFQKVKTHKGIATVVAYTESQVCVKYNNNNLELTGIEQVRMVDENNDSLLMNNVSIASDGVHTTLIVSDENASVRIDGVMRFESVQEPNNIPETTIVLAGFPIINTK